MTEELSLVIQSCKVLDENAAHQFFPVEIRYIKDGKEYVRLTTATEIIMLFENVSHNAFSGSVGP